MRRDSQAAQPIHVVSEALSTLQGNRQQGPLVTGKFFLPSNHCLPALPSAGPAVTRTVKPRQAKHARG